MKILRHRGETLTLATALGFATVRTAPPGTDGLFVEVPSATTENISLAFTPKIHKVWFYDNSAASWTDLTPNLTDRNTSTGTGSSYNAMQAVDYTYIGCGMRFGGLAVDVTNTNSLGTATMGVGYWNGTTWADITPTDGTFSTRTLAQDGLITWTVPTNWAVTTVNGGPSLFWVRLNTSADLTDTTVSVVELSTLANLTVNSVNTDAEGFDYLLIQSNNRTLPPYFFGFDSGVWGGIQMISTSITSACNLNWVRCVGY